MSSLVETERDLAELVSRLSSANTSRIAIDIESNGLFKFQATLCTLQIAHDGVVHVVDPFTTPLEALRPIVTGGPKKIIHDVAFDARILAETNLPLSNVLDTSIAARMLGRTATGLASLLLSELGVTVDKKLQHHDWTERPITAEQLRYLGDDVAHLEALADKLWAEVTEKGIGDAVEEETRYRVAQAIEAIRVGDPRPPYIRLKGLDRAPKEDLPLLRRLAAVREDKARELDVPPYKVLGPDVIFAIARARPASMNELLKVKGATSGHRARGLAQELLEAVARGLEDGGIPEEDRAMLKRPHVPPPVAKARRAREGRLSGWRKSEAKKRLVDEQVVMPGHCLQDLAGLLSPTMDDIAAVAGIGAFRVERDGAAILALLTRPTSATDDVKTTIAALDRERADSVDPLEEEEPLHVHVSGAPPASKTVPPQGKS